ncbi:MAG: DUF2062 domain-containing protein [Elusimicrobiota bacterium]
MEFPARIKEKLLYLIKLNSPPEKIAGGFAVGAFIGIFPTFWLGGILALFVAKVFKLNYAATLLGAVIVMNPVTTPIFWALSATVGAFIFSSDSRELLQKIKDGITLDSIGDITLIYLAGNFIVSSIISFASFFAAKKLITVYKERKKINY